MFLFYQERKIYYSDSGAGPAIVLLHGYLESSEIWSSFEVALSKDFRVVSVDLPGHGKSDIYGETHTMEFMAIIVKELIVALGIKKIFLTGHSLGGYVALAFLELFPEFLSGYALFHSHPFPDPPEAIEKRLREIAIVRAGKKDLMYPDNIIRMFAPSNLEYFSEAIQRSKDIASRIEADGIIAVLNGMMKRPSRLWLMEEGRVPCLWILGRMDNYIPCDLFRSRVKLPHNAEVEILENSGHLGFIEELPESVKILREFILNLPDGSPVNKE
jgi:pimeloyl-ACP methyl ester carboxylesterase